MRMRGNLRGLNDAISDAAAFNLDVLEAPQSNDPGIPSLDTGPVIDYGPTSQFSDTPVPSNDTPSSFNLDNIFSSLANFGAKVVVPIYTANLQSKAQQALTQYKIQAQNPRTPMYRTAFTGGTQRNFSQPSASAGGLLPVFLISGAALAFFLIIRK